MKRSTDKFELSAGNLRVLETIPKMMTDKKFRTELRKLTIDYITKENKNIAFKNHLNNQKIKRRSE